ncbi:hypothetical protein JCM3775_006271 [Rhodotorula graminis]
MADPEHDNLPPLPPPLPPTHARSFSSSSSSSAGGSPRPANGAGALSGALPPLKRSDSGASISSTSTSASAASATRRRRNAARSGDAGAYGSLSAFSRGQSPALARTLSSASSASASSSTGSSRPLRDRSALSAAAISAADLDFPRSSSSFSSDSKVASPSPTSSSFHHHHHTTASLGLGGSPSFPAPSAFFSSHSHSRPPPPPPQHQQQLPSPPRTASDSGTLRRAPAPQRVAVPQLQPGQQLDATGPSPTRPERPPRDARRSASTSTTPNLSSSSAFDPIEDASRPTAVSRTSSSGPSAAAAASTLDTDHDLGLGAPVSRSPSLSRSEAGEGGFAHSAVDGADEAERRRERRARRADELREKNQRILDSINGRAPGPLPAAAPSPPPTSANPAAARDVPGLRRSETSSTLRDVGGVGDGGDLGSLSLLSDEPAPTYARLDSGDSASSWLDDTRRAEREFGVQPPRADVDAGFARSRTLGDLARTAAAPSSSPSPSSSRSPFPSAPVSAHQQPRTPSALDRHASLREYAPATAPRASTSLGYSAFHSSGTGSLRSTPRRSEVLLANRDRDRPRDRAAQREPLRAATALGSPEGGAARDAAIERSLRVSASRDALSSFASSGSGSGVGPAPWSVRERVRSDPRRSVSRVDWRRDGTAGAEEDDDEQELGRDVRRHMRAATASPTLAAAVRRPASSLALGREAPSRTHGRDTLVATRRAGQRRGGGSDEELEELEHEEETTPKSGRKRASKESGGSGGAGGTDGRYSRLSGARAGVGRNGFASMSPLSPTSTTSSHVSPPPSSARSDDRLSSVSTEARRERLKGVDVGSEAWMAEFDDLRRRTVRSRASGRSADAASSAHNEPDLERERTIRAINALLAGQGIVATAAALPPSSSSPDEPLSPASSSSTSSPHKRQPSERLRRTSIAASPSSRTLNGIADRAGAESVLGGLINHGLRAAGPTNGTAAGVAEAEQHHRLLFSALEQFEAHFGAADAGGELVSRMDALVTSTTRLNGGLRGLAHSVREAQVAAQLDEDRLGAGADGDLAPFEKSVAALLRASDDQVRCLTEDMVAFARLDRERERRARREGSADAAAGTSRPVSRASTYRSSMGGGGGGGALYSPPKRAATASPFDSLSSGSALVSHAAASSRSPALGLGKKDVLRDPLSPALDGLRSSAATGSARRHTLGFASGGRGGAGAGAYYGAGQDSPTPSSGRRGEGVHGRSPLATQTSRAADGAFDTPSRSASAAGILRRQSLTSSSATAPESLAGLGLPLPGTAGSSTRRGKTSDTTVRPSSPTSVRFPTQDHLPTTRVDTASANTRTSPTQAPPAGPFRAYSDRDQSRALRALELGANLDEEPQRNSFERDVLGADDDDDDEALARELALQLQEATAERDLPDLPAASPAGSPSVPTTSTVAAVVSQYPYAGPVVNIARPNPQQQQQQESPTGMRSKSRLRLSSGGLGAALKNALSRAGGGGGGGSGERERKSSGEGEAAGSPVRGLGMTPSASRSSMASFDRPSSVASTTDERRVERRREVEAVLRQARR